MAGHNKWTQIKRQKGVADAKKSKLFSMLARQIVLEAKKSNGDRQAAGLRTIIEKARAANMPNDNIDRAIKNATDSSAADYEEVIYEAYGPGGVAILIIGLTASKNRTHQELKHLLGAYGSALAAPGAALWAFQKIGHDWQATNSLDLSLVDQSKLTELVLALESNDDIRVVFTNSRTTPKL